MNNHAQALHDARLAEDAAKYAISLLRAPFEDSIAAELAAYAEAKVAREQAEEAMRSAALAEWEQTKDRKAIGGAEVKLYDVLDYPDADALAWAKESGLCLVLDKKAFEKVAKATPLPFVTTRQEPRVSLASDLSAIVP